MMDTVYWINGERADQLPVNHRGLHYGDGVFETVAVKQGEALLWERHLTRLKRGIAALKLRVDLDAVQREVNTALVDKKNGVLKLILAREHAPESSRGYTPAITAGTTRIVQFTEGQPQKVKAGKLITSPYAVACAPDLVGLKTLNALPYVLASQCLVGSDAVDALVCDASGAVVEGTKSNVFWLNEQNELCTPALDRAGVAGVVREEILSRAEQLLNEAKPRVTLRVVNARLCDMMRAKEVFVCNSIMGVVPITHIDGMALPELHEDTIAGRIQSLMNGRTF